MAAKRKSTTVRPIAQIPTTGKHIYDLLLETAVATADTVADATDTSIEFDRSTGLYAIVCGGCVVGYGRSYTEADAILADPYAYAPSAADYVWSN